MCFPVHSRVPDILSHNMLLWHVDQKKKAQCESCELSFIWGKMRAAAWEIEAQIALRSCFKEAGVGGAWW